ncbi:MAG: hypothetical protein JST02_00165 [Bacteroidetes bacterium]|nr:hypothetical protein [Bacteroidota bacterium]
MKLVIKDLEQGITYGVMVSRYSSLVKNSDSNFLVIKLKTNPGFYKNYLSGSAYEGFDYDPTLPNSQQDLKKGNWYYYYSKKESYREEYTLDCIYLKGDFKQTNIHPSYSRLIQYVDCLIDTSTLILLRKEKDDDLFNRFSYESSPLYKKLNAYINKKMHFKRGDRYSYDYLVEEKVKFVKDSLCNDTYTRSTLAEIADEFIKAGIGEDGLEELVELFVSKQKALEMKRNRVVYGACSMDQSPRFHARNIARLAAETHSWDIFLRSHLDIMNDRFERMSDGSYAWGSRQTYLKELEELDINVLDLLFGLSLRAENVSENHYFGTIWRLGKALCESKNRLLFEERIMAMMKENQLDRYNASLLFLLYNSYLQFLSDKTEANKKIDLIKKDIADYPEFIQPAITKLKPQSAN